MTTEVATVNGQNLPDAIERVLLEGDLSRLTAEQRMSYYNAVCTSVGINKLTRPFSYLRLSGKLVLYATKDATDQLRKIHGVSIEDLQDEKMDDIYRVKAKAKDRDGRTDFAIGAVNVANLKGESLANALMKAETKAKRRVTLSICGLGMLDETEVDSIPGAERVSGEGFESPTDTITEEQQKELDALIKGAKLAMTRFFDRYHVAQLSELRVADFERAKKDVEDYAKKQKGAA